MVKTKGLIPFIEDCNLPEYKSGFEISDIESILDALNESVTRMERSVGIVRLTDHECANLPKETLEGLLSTMEVWASLNGVKIIKQRME